LWVNRWRHVFTPIEIKQPSQFTIWSGLDDFPAISPEGKSVAYCSDHNGIFEIYAKALTFGAKEIQLTNDNQQNFEPARSPDGERIAFYSKQRGGIWIIHATGGDAKQLTYYKKLNSFVRYPSWSSLGNQVAYENSETTGNIWVTDLK
jgi:TolB protein